MPGNPAGKVRVKWFTSCHNSCKAGMLEKDVAYTANSVQWKYDI